MQKNIWIVNQYSGSKYHGMNYRSYYIGRELHLLGHSVRLFAGSFSHLLRVKPEFKGKFKEENIDGIDYVWVKTKKYTGSKSLGRIIGMFQFIWNLLFIKHKKYPKPDVIIVSSISSLPVLNAYCWAKKYKAKLIFEVRDIWPLSLVELGNVSRFHPFVIFLQWVENFAYRKADKVVSVLPNALLHMQEHGLSKEKFVHIPNGIDCSEYLSVSQKALPDYRKKASFVIGYMGTFGISNALDFFIDAAEKLKGQTDIRFVMVGQGPEEQKLRAKIIQKQLANIEIFPAVNKNQVQSVLQQFDACYVGWFAHPLYRFGISPNKIFEYMLSGKPVIHSSNATNDPINDANCGISVAAEDTEAIVNAIVQLKNTNEKERQRLGQNGKIFVQQNHDYKTLAKNYEQLF